MFSTAVSYRKKKFGKRKNPSVPFSAGSAKPVLSPGLSAPAARSRSQEARFMFRSNRLRYPIDLPGKQYARPKRPPFRLSGADSPFISFKRRDLPGPCSVSRIAADKNRWTQAFPPTGSCQFPASGKPTVKKAIRFRLLPVYGFPASIRR